MGRIPNTLTKVRTNLGLAIRVRGVTVGMIQTWTYTLSRGATHLYELNPDSGGEPVDVVPGNVTGQTITVRRVDLYVQKMEEAFGLLNLNTLADQSNPFEIVEVWKNPDGSTEMYIYEGCWFTRINRTNDAGGNRIVTAEGEIAYVRRRRVQ